MESEKEVTDVTPSQDGGKSNRDMTWHAEKAKSLDHFPDDLQSDVEKFFSKKPNTLKRKFHVSEVIAKLYMHYTYVRGNTVHHSEGSM